MNKIIYNKLIRDRIPEIIQDAGKQFEIVVMDEEEYREALRKKLIEEAEEVKKCSPCDLTKELADLQEVIETLKSVYGITTEQLNTMRSRRIKNRGGFEKRIKLIWSEDK